MVRKLTIIITLVCLWGISGSAVAQQKKKPTASTNTSWDARMEDEPREKKQYKTIYRRDTYGIFLGNKCVQESTQKMGFRYELVHKQGAGSKTAVGVLLHNAGTKMLLLFKNGPFWQCRLRKRIDECRIRTGDYIGGYHSPADKLPEVK